jgi:hypothetical protein
MATGRRTELLCAAHFLVPAAGAFVQEVSALAASPPEISIYEARALSL